MRGTVFVVEEDGEERAAVHAWIEAAHLECRCYAAVEALLGEFEPRAPLCVVVGLGTAVGLELHRRIRERWSEPTVVVLCGPDERIADAVRALHGGVFDVLEKPCEPAALLECVQRALQHDRARERRRRQRAEVRARLAELTTRQREVLENVVRGKANKVTAMELGLAEKTVELHRARMMKKMGASSVPDLLRMWIDLHGE